MVALKEIDAQLERVGMKNRFFGRPEVRELCHILAPGEVIQHAVNGQYEGGIALMLATDRRILLIDKKPWFLTMEDIRYDMVSEVDFYARLLDATVSLITFNKKLVFTSWRQARLREMVRYIQHRVMQLRHIEDNWQEQQVSAEAQGQSMIGKVMPTMTNSQPTTPQQDFMKDYQAHVKRHSMAHVAGKFAVNFTRSKPIIKPLYPRPSLVARYRTGNVMNQTPQLQNR